MIEDQEVAKTSIGEILSKARIKRGITAKDVEKIIKIRSKYLTAIENGDYNQIPGQAYVIGFIKTYAGYLELDAQALIDRYKGENEDMIKQSNPFVIGDEDESKKRSSRRIILLILFIAVIVVTVFVVRSGLFL